MSIEKSAGPFEAVPRYCELDSGVLGRVAVMNPSGNTTAVVIGEPQGADLKELNGQIMRAWDTSGDMPEIEQCCYVTQPSDTSALALVQMFGGEFCGNATRSAVEWLCGGRDSKGLIEVSGVGYPLEFEVNNGEVAVQMPLPSEGLVEKVDEGVLVTLDGISQLVVTEPEESQAERRLLVDLLGENKYGLRDKPAVGVSYYDRASGRAKFDVWVNAVDTMFKETACGSGTCAIGIAEAIRQGRSVRLEVIQPSGESIFTEAEYALGGVAKAFIAGKVNRLYDGEMRLA